MESKKWKIDISDIVVKSTPFDLILNKLRKIEEKLDGYRKEVKEKDDKIQELEKLIQKISLEKKKDHQMSYVS